MKKMILFLVLVLNLYSCGSDTKEAKNSDHKASLNSSNSFSENSELPDNETEQILKENVNSSLNDLVNLGQGLLENSGGNNGLELQFDTETLLNMLEQSGVSREEMEKLINNPDSLKVLAQQAMKERQEAQENEHVFKGKFSKAQLSSKNTLSLEEAILLVQAESGPEATMAKLKKIDSLAGTNVMQQMDLTQAGYVMRGVERINEPKANAEEVEEIEKLRLLSGQLHGEKEARELLAELEEH